MAFDEGPSFDEPVQPYQQDFTVSWTGLVSRTITLWTRKLAQYIMIVGLPVIIYSIIEFVVLYTLFGDFAITLIGTISSEAISLIFNLFLITSDLVLFGVIIMLSVVSIIIYALVAGAIFKFGLDNYGAPDRGDVGESLSFAVGRIVPLILVRLLVGLIILAIVLPGAVFLVFGLVMSDLSAFMIGGLALGVGGLISIYVGVRLSIATILVVAEDISVVDAVKKSYAMTASQFWHIFAGQFLLGLVVGVIGLVIGLLTIPLLLAFGGTIVAAVIATVIVTVITQIVLSPLSYIFYVVLYRDLQSRTSMVAQQWW